MRTGKVIIFVCLLLLSVTAFSQNDNAVIVNDTLTNDMRIEELKTQKNILMDQIKIEDAKRNMFADSLSFEQMEMINNRQDSICLDLRSKLTYINLELRELEMDNATSIILDKMDLINQNNQNKN